MPRPRKLRRLHNVPQRTVYKPAGIPLFNLPRVTLLYEELEALRLADLEGLTQAEAAERMQVSRSTFQRILEAGHRKVAMALTRGSALFIEGGTFTVTPHRRNRE